MTNGSADQEDQRWKKIDALRDLIKDCRQLTTTVRATTQDVSIGWAHTISSE